VIAGVDSTTFCHLTKKMNNNFDNQLRFVGETKLRLVGANKQVKQIQLFFIKIQKTAGVELQE
jgi:hypothetical protein